MQIAFKKVFLYFSFSALLFSNYAFAENAVSVKKSNGSSEHQSILSFNQQCPADNFSSFLKLYANDKNIQSEFTKFPLQESVIVDAEPEPKQITRLLSKSQAKFPLMPLTDERKKQGLTLAVIQQKQSPYEVKLEKPDTGYLVHYFFAKERKCWRLIRIKDSSL